MWEVDELQYCAKYPFSSKTKDVAKWLNFDLNNIEPNVLTRAKQRALEGIESNTIKLEARSHSHKILLTEILSYPVAKIIVGLTRDKFLIKKYAGAEANSLRKSLFYESESTCRELAQDLGIIVDNNSVVFTDYVNNIPQRDEYRLVNSKLDKGRVYLTKSILTEVLSEQLKNQLEHQLSQRFRVPEFYQNYADELKREVSRDKAFASTSSFGRVNTALFPPCMKAIINHVQSGSPVAHQPRFVLAAFLANVNMPTEQIMDLFRSTPNFNEKKTKYYIEYTMGKRGSGIKYSPPGCEKMVLYGLCVNKDALCDRISHPLRYYGVKKGIKRGKKK